MLIQGLKFEEKTKLPSKSFLKLPNIENRKDILGALQFSFKVKSHIKIIKIEQWHF